MREPRKSQSEKTTLSRADRANILRYLEHNRGNRQYRHAPSAGWSTGKILKPLTKKFGSGKSDLQAHWPEIVGDKWAALSAPFAIRGSKTGKTLVIEAKGPAAALISANSTQLLAKINQFLGAGSITKISVKQGRIAAPKKKPEPLETKAPQKLPSALEQSIENRLQQALDNLADKIKPTTK